MHIAGRSTGAPTWSYIRLGHLTGASDFSGVRRSRKLALDARWTGMCPTNPALWDTIAFVASERVTIARTMPE